MRMGIKYLLPVFLLLITSPIFAQEQGEEIEKDIKFEAKAPEKAYAGEQFRLVYTLINADVSEINFPENIKGFDIIYGPSRSSSQSTQIIGGKKTSTSSVSFMYILSASKAGKYKLPEVTVEVNGKKYKTGQPQIEIISSGNKNENDRTGNSRRKQDNKQSKKKYEIKDKDAFIKTIVEEEEIDGEKVFEVSLRLYLGENTDISGISSISAFKEPDFSKFRILNSWTPDRRMAKIKDDGKIYYAADIRKYLLLPKQSGKIDIDGGHFDLILSIKTGEVEQTFFGPVEKEVEIKKTIEIQPFTIDAGLVGDWHAI